MIGSIRQIQKKWGRTHERIQRELSRAVKKENMARDKVVDLKKEEQRLDHEIDATRQRCFRGRTIALESYQTMNRHCASLNRQLAVTRGVLVDARKTLNECTATRKRLSDSLAQVANRLEQLEIQIGVHVKALRIRASAIREEENLETWLAVRSSMVFNLVE